VASIAMLFCFPLQNFTKIGQSAAELWPKTIFKMAAVRHLEFKNYSSLITRLLSSTKCCVLDQVSSKSDHFSLRYGDITIFKMADVRNLEF